MEWRLSSSTCWSSLEPRVRRYHWSCDFPVKPELLIYKRELLVALENVDLNVLIKHLVKDLVISQEVSKYFNKLDYDRLEHIVVAGFLVNELLRSIKMVQPSLDKLEKEVSDAEHFCAIVKSCLDGKSTENTNSGGIVKFGSVDSPKEIASIYHPGIGQKQYFPDTTDTLTYNDIPLLTMILCRCSHKWEVLGIALYLPEHELAECRKASSNASSLHRVLSTRFRQDRSTFTLQTLKDALESDIVCMKSLADSLEEEYKKQKELTSKKPRPPLIDENNTVVACDGKATLLGLPGSDKAESYEWKKQKAYRVIPIILEFLMMCF